MKTCWVILGAFGDVCNALPLVWEDFVNGNHPTVMISQEFQTLLDGISYADRFVWDKHYSFFNDAAAFAEKTKRFDRIIIPQCYGPPPERFTDSFCKEAWRLVGKLALWDKLPLIFDCRNSARENILLDRIGDKALPKVLVSTSGKSSPFPNRPALLNLLQPLKEKYDFIDLDGFRAERFYDLLGLMEKAKCLIATDSGPLHLAQAVPALPVIALITHSPDLWHGSPRRRNHIGYIRYNEFPSRCHEIPALLESLEFRNLNVDQSRLIHVWCEYDRRDRRTIHRHKIAKQTWQEEYKHGPWVDCMIHENELPRNATLIGEQKPVPFLKDLFTEAANRAKSGDIIVFTNDDTCLAPGVTTVILETIKARGAMWGARMEHVAINQPLTLQQMATGYKHCGSDIFAFSIEWFEKFKDEIPDFLISFEAWDMVLKRLINLRGGIEVENTCYHEIHLPYWHTAQNRECTGNLYNRELTRQWLAKNQIAWNDAFA